MWDSGVVLGKFLEHAVDTGHLSIQGKKVVELGSGCGLVGYERVDFLLLHLHLKIVFCTLFKSLW